MFIQGVTFVVQKHTIKYHRRDVQIKSSIIVVCENSISPHIFSPLTFHKTIGLSWCVIYNTF